MIKDMDAIDKITEEIIKNNEELENTINKMIIKDGTDYDNDIINMLNDLMEEGKERLEKLVDTHRAASAPKSRAASAPRSRAASAPTSRADPAPMKKETEPTRARRMRREILQQDDPSEAMMSETAFNGTSAPKLDENKSWANDLINGAQLVSVRILRNRCKKYVTLNRKDQGLWPCVARRITKDLETSEVLADEDVTQMTNEELHRA